jgi:hypothetical protein
VISLPDSAKVNVSHALARDLHDAAQRLPHYDNREFYSTSLQISVLEKIRAVSPDAFDSLIDEIKARLRRRQQSLRRSQSRFR